MAAHAIDNKVQYRPNNKKELNKNKRLTFWTSLKNWPYEKEFVLPTQVRKRAIIQEEQHAGRV